MAALIVAACGGGGDSGPVRITGSDTFVDDLGAQQQLFAAERLSASYTDAEGTEVALSIEPDTDGNGVVIPGAPDGDYLLRVREIDSDLPLYVVTSERAIDVSRVYHGRAENYLGTVPLGGARAWFDITGLEAWQATDQLHVYSTGANGYESRLGRPDFLDIQPGSTQVGGLLSGAQIPGMGFPIPDDRFWLYQLSTRPLSDGTYQALSRVMNISGAEMEVTFNGAMTEVAQDESITIDWRGAEFANLGSEVNPASEPGFTLLYLSARPGDVAWGAYGRSADLAYAYRALDEAVDQQATLSYGDPFPAEWTRYVTAQNWYRMPYTIGDSGTTQVWARTWRSARADGDTVDMAPSISPPSNVLVDGMPAVEGATIAPGSRLEWTAPSIGTATYYEVGVLGLFNAGTGLEPQRSITGYIITSDTSVRLPDELVFEADAYLVVVLAVSSPEMDPARPMAQPWPSAGAEVVVGRLYR